MRALALSPHLDDAVFSCGGTLAVLAERGWRVSVATLFTQSVPHPTGFALACQLDKGLSPEVDYMALRRAEDASSCAVLGVTPHWLPFREAPHRGYHSASALFQPPHDRDAIVEELAPAIAELIRSLQPDLLLLPQAIGGHVDHVQVIRAVDQLDPPIPMLWWRDFPYVARDRQAAEPFAARMAALPEQVVAIDEARKYRACAAYTTQLGFQFGGAAGLQAALQAAGPEEGWRGAAPVPA